jgi:hypothetical protein
MLDGHALDLAALVRRFPTGDPRVVSTDEGTFIEAAVLDAVEFTDTARLVETASDILARLNGWVMLDDAGYRPVKLRNRFHRDRLQREAGDTHIALGDEARVRDEVSVVVVGTAEARLGLSATITATASTGGVPGPPPIPEGQRQLARAAAHPDADDLLALIGTAGAFGWAPLWKALEIIKVALGGKTALLGTGWVTADDLDAFGYSANHPDASGADARHARRPPTTPPSRVMSIEEGQQFIRDLARQWLNSLP